MTASQRVHSGIKVNQEILICGEIFRALKVDESGVYFAKVLIDGKLASHTSGKNHGRYSHAEINKYASLGAMEI